MTARPQPRRPRTAPSAVAPTSSPAEPPLVQKVRRTPKGTLPGPHPPDGITMILGLFFGATGIATYGWLAIVLRCVGAALITIYALRYVVWRKHIGGGWLWH